MATAGSIVVDLLARTGAFDTSIDRSTKAAEKRMREMERTVSQAGTAIGAAMAAAGVAAVAMGKQIIDGLDQFNDVADATAASIENLSALEDIAARTGTSFDKVTGALVKFNDVLKDAEPGTKAAAIIERLGLQVDTLRKMDPAVAMHEVAKALAQWANDGDKARAVQELLGKSVRDVAAFVKDLGEQGKLSATVMTDQARAAEKFNQQLFAMEKNVKDAGRAIVGEFLPALNKLAEKGRDQGLMALLGFDRDFFDTKALAGKAQEMKRALEDLNRVKREFMQGSATQAQVDAAQAEFEASRSRFKRADAARLPMADVQAFSDMNESEFARLSARTARTIGPLPTGKAPKPAKAPRAPIEKPFATSDRFDEASAAQRTDEIRNEAQAWAKYWHEVQAVEEPLRSAAIQMNETQRMALELGQSFSGAIRDMVIGGGDFDDVLKRMALSVADLILQVGVLEPMMAQLRIAMGVGGGTPPNPFAAGAGGGIDWGGLILSGIGGMFGGMFGGGGFVGPPNPFLADGGPANANTPYIVGERGPELFVPRTAGMVVPNHDLLAGAGGPVNVSVVNQTTGRVDQVAQQRLSPTDLVLILQETRRAVAGDLHNPNSDIRRSLHSGTTARPRR